MALPRLDVPRYKTTLPSSGMEIEYRPFLVKEEKILILASESDDPKDIDSAINQIIENCTFNKVNLSELSRADFEWLLLQMRKRAKGKDVSLSFRCTHEIDGEVCGAVTDVQASVDDVEYVGSEVDPKISFTDTIGVKMKEPSMKALEKIENGDGPTASFDLIISAMDMIYSGDEVFIVKDLDRKEVEDFLDSLSSEQFEKMKRYIDSLPKLVLALDFTCSKCGSNETIEITGIEDFFV